MAARQSGQIKPLAFLVTGVFVALVLLFIACTKLQQASYAKLAPLSLELGLTNNIEQSVIVEYDYGYGFNPGHSQERRIFASDRSQLLAFSVSSWKKIKRLRIRVSDQEQLDLNSVTLQRAGSMVRMLGVPKIESALQIVFQLENLDDVLSHEGGQNAG